MVGGLWASAERGLNLRPRPFLGRAWPLGRAGRLLREGRPGISPSPQSTGRRGVRRLPVESGEDGVGSPTRQRGLARRERCRQMSGRPGTPCAKQEAPGCMGMPGGARGGRRGSNRRLSASPGGRRAGRPREHKKGLAGAPWAAQTRSAQPRPAQAREGREPKLPSCVPQGSPV